MHIQFRGAMYINVGGARFVRSHASANISGGWDVVFVLLNASFGGSWDAPGGVRGAPTWEGHCGPGVWGRVGLGYLLNL